MNETTQPEYDLLKFDAIVAADEALMPFEMHRICRGEH
jgi:hypothetical protein